MTAILYSVHMMLAKTLNVDELALSMPESEALASAIANVEKHYDVFQGSAKVADWVNLAIVGASVYGTRYAAYKTRINNEKKQKEKPSEPFGGLYVVKDGVNPP
jgi:hypothetical protein